MIYLETPRVRLEEFAWNEKHLMTELDSDPEVMRFLTDGRPSSPEEIDGGFGRIQALYKKFPEKFGVWKAMNKDSGEFMGWFLFRPGKADPDNVKEIELGYRLKKKFWGKGFGTEVSRALIDKGFRSLGVEVVWAMTLRGNLASQNIMRKVGMTLEKEFLQDELQVADRRAVKYSLRR